MQKLLTAMLTIALSVLTALSLTACGKVTYKDLQIVELNAEIEYFGIAFRNLVPQIQKAFLQFFVVK